MRDPKRIPKILKEIGEIWVRFPDLRLMQFLINAIGFQNDGYGLEDEDLLKKLNNLYDEANWNHPTCISPMIYFGKDKK